MGRLAITDWGCKMKFKLNKDAARDANEGVLRVVLRVVIAIVFMIAAVVFVSAIGFLLFYYPFIAAFTIPSVVLLVLWLIMYKLAQ
jgi:hypothetical protein